MLRKLEIILKAGKFLDFLKELIDLDIFEKLKDLHIITTVTDDIEIIEIATIIKHDIFTDSTKFFSKLKLLKDLEELKKISDKFDYFNLMITKLNLYSIILSELIQIFLYMKKIDIKNYLIKFLIIATS